MINDEVRHIIEAELMDGEELLWADRPAKFPITLKFIGSIIQTFVLIITLGTVLFFMSKILFFILLMILGLYLTYRLYEAKLQVYAITRNRLIIKNQIKFGRTYSLVGGKSWWSQTEIRNDNIGTIYFSSTMPRPFIKFYLPCPVVLPVAWPFNGVTWVFPQHHLQALFNIRDAAKVKELVPFGTMPWK